MLSIENLLLIAMLRMHAQCEIIIIGTVHYRIKLVLKSFMVTATGDNNVQITQCTSLYSVRGVANNYNCSIVSVIVVSMCAVYKVSLALSNAEVPEIRHWVLILLCEALQSLCLAVAVEHLNHPSRRLYASRLRGSIATFA